MSSITTFSDLPSEQGRHELSIPIGDGRSRPSLPVRFHRGAALHPLLAVTAMVHGDEYEGFGGVLQLWKRIERRRISGSVLMLPVCNSAAARAATRRTPDALDGLDLARVFPGSARGSFTRRLARRIWDLVAPADVLVDLHSGGAGYEYLPMTGFYRARDREIAECFPIRTLWKIPSNPGVLSYELVRRGRRAMGTEFAGEARSDPRGVAACTKGLLRIMHHLKMIAAPPRATAIQRRRLLTKTSYQLTDRSGWFVRSVAPGQRIVRRQPIGEWIDEDLNRSTLTCRDAGTVTAVRTLPRVDAGDYLVVTGR